MFGSSAGEGSFEEAVVMGLLKDSLSCNEVVGLLSIELAEAELDGVVEEPVGEEDSHLVRP